MKKILLMLGLVQSIFLFGQNDRPKEVTAADLQQFKAAIEKQVPALRKELELRDYSSELIEFSIDTFRINHLAEMRMEVDYSTYGMNLATDVLRDEYDKLLNKYYYKLMKRLKPEDQKALIAAQQTWIVFRDKEFALGAVLAKTEYSGGGTIQTTILAAAHLEVVRRRTCEIADYFFSME